VPLGTGNRHRRPILDLATVDQVTSGGRLAGIDVADHDQVHVNLVLAHLENGVFPRFFLRKSGAKNAQTKQQKRKN
jgi:hypothetical protein